jgi:Protein of unknown function (DUF2442)/Helix-turn-helix domain
VKPRSWRIAAARAGPGRRLVVTWRGGGESVIDLAQYLSEYVIFAPLRSDDELFGRVAVGEWGWCAHWSDDMEISSDTLHRLALEQGGAWLRAWRAAHRMTEAEAARALGVSARLWRSYESGSQLLPKTLRLAGIGLDAEAEAA